MEIRRPDPQPRTEGNYDVYVNGIAYGKPYASIKLSEDNQLRLDDITLGDALRLAAASAQVAAELTAAHARLGAPHGGDHFWKGTCQLCGKPEDDELHAEPEPELYAAAIQQAAYFAQPGNTIDDLLAEQRAAS